MANSNHVQKLMEGVAAWNQWRSENPNISIDLNSADLRDVELPGANLREANLDGCNLRRAVLDNADLSSANLVNAILTRALLRTASLSGANVTGARLDYVDASDANFGEAILTNGNFSYAKLVGANLRKANCKDANFVHAEVNGSDLTRTDFRDSNLEKAQFVEASLEGADLRRCKLGTTSFKLANLSRANLRGANLNQADLTDAKLTHADLREVTELSCDQLTQAQDWETAYRDAELACDAAIPVSDEGVIIEVPTAHFTISGKPPTVEIEETEKRRFAKAPQAVITAETAEEIDEATRQRFNETPATVVAEAIRARDTTIALQTILRDLRLNNPEAQELLDKQADSLDNIIAILQSNGDKEAARKTLRDLLYDVLESFLQALAENSPMKGILAAAALASLSLTGVEVTYIVAALVAGPIVGIDAKALKRILSRWKEKKEKGE